MVISFQMFQTNLRAIIWFYSPLSQRRTQGNFKGKSKLHIKYFDTEEKDQQFEIPWSPFTRMTTPLVIGGEVYVFLQHEWPYSSHFRIRKLLQASERELDVTSRLIKSGLSDRQSSRVKTKVECCWSCRHLGNQVTNCFASSILT